MKKFSKNKTLVFAIVLLAVLVAISFFRQSKTSVINVAPVREAEEEKETPILITSKTIKEENWSGTVAVITGGSPVALKAREYIDERISEFRKQANTDVPDMREQFGEESGTTEYTLDIEAKHIKGEKTESLAISIYTYTGGAHGSSFFKVITASKSEGKILSLSAIIKQDKQAAFTEFVKKQLNDWRPNGADASVVFEDSVKDLGFDSFKNWSLDEKNLIIYFEQYEIGPGVLGAVAFPLPLPKIQDFLIGEN